MLYSVDGKSNLVVIDPSSGGHPVATLDLGVVVPDMRGLSFSPDGTLFGINNGSPDDLNRIDVTTGVGALVGTTGRTAL